MKLSLKNLYKLLMSNDFPIYSESVIGEKQRKGQTALRFWQHQLVDEFRSQTYGSMIWRNNGKRNRYTSHLCNRSGELRCYREYAQELAAEINETVLLGQISRFATFLQEKDYKHDILIRRIQEMIRMCEQEDPCVSPEITTNIVEGLTCSPAIHRGGIPGKHFQAAYLLTILSFYAAAGEAMDDPVLAVLREKAYSMDSLWDSYTRQEEARSQKAVFLTNHIGILQDNILPRHRFFGREEALYDLKEMAAAGDKCILSGIGGQGKTELLRQLIRQCTEEQIVDALAVIPYETGLAESFRRSFPKCQGHNAEEALNLGLYLLRKEAKEKRVLLLIDNVTGTMEEDPDLEKLLHLPCGVLITTRHAALDGFETYRLPSLSISTGALIFRDNYEKMLSADDRELLRLLLRDEAICHPLTLRLMARSARSRNWSLQELKEHLEHDGVSLSWNDGDHMVYLSRFYHQLYNYPQIPEECRRLAELFTLLPRASYGIAFLKKWFPALCTANLEESLNLLAERGWLEPDGDGYSMHPLIAQCLRKKVITEKKIEPVLMKIRGHLQQKPPGALDTPVDPELDQVCGILRYIAGFMTGSVSKEWFHALAYALYEADNTPQVQARTFPLLGKYEKRCTEKDDTSRISAVILRCYWLTVEPEQYISAYESQQQARTISEPLYLSLCLHAGYSAVFQHGNYSLGEKLLREALDGDSNPGQKILAYFNLVHCCHSAGKTFDALHWAEEGNQFAHAHPECGDMGICKLLSLLCQVHCILRRKEAAEALLPELHSRLAATDIPDLQYYLLNALSTYESEYGSPHKSLQYSQEILKIIEQLRGKGLDYYVCLGSYGSVLKDLNRFAEALTCFDEALAYYRPLNQGYWIQNLCCRAAVTCLAAKQPQRALAYLDEACPHAAELGGYPLAVCHYSYSEAYAQLGDQEQEHAYLRKALPELEARLGADDPKCVRARERLAQLETHKIPGKQAESSADIRKGD